nr:MAG: internal scaffolding protein [Microvirus sp.]
MSKNAKSAQASHDFHKSNGQDHGFATVGPSLTRQEFAEECDINTLMARYDTAIIGGPGNLPPIGPDNFVDWTTQPSTLLEYMDVMRTAETAFMSLNASIRKEFDNDPVEFVAFASDPENRAQMATWGLANPIPPPEPEPEKAPPAPPQGAPTHGST